MGFQGYLRAAVLQDWANDRVFGAHLLIGFLPCLLLLISQPSGLYFGSTSSKTGTRPGTSESTNTRCQP